MASYLQRKEGVYEAGKRYAFTNISDKPFEIKWNGQIVKVVQPDETIEISDATPYPGPGNGDCIGRTKTIELATKIILGEAKVDTDRLGFTTDKSYVSPVGTRAGIPEARKPYEQKILRELPVSENVDFLNKMKADEIIQDSRKQQGVDYSNHAPEFANAPNGGMGSGKEMSADIPKATEEILKPKVGRPRKNETAVE